MVDHLLYVSPSKSQFAFPKALRFAEKRSPTMMVSDRSMDKLSDFDKIV